MTNATTEQTTVRELTLTTDEPTNRHGSFVGLTPKFGIPLVAFLVLLSITIVYLRYRIERKTYMYMVPLFKHRQQRRDEEDSQEDARELRDMESLPSYILVQPPPEYQAAVHMPKPDSSRRHCLERDDKYVLVSDQDL